MKKLRMGIIIMAALGMTACVNVQCAAGRNINQTHYTDPLLGYAAFFGVVVLFVFALAALAGPGLGSGPGGNE